MTETISQVEMTEEQDRRFRKVRGAMPYGASIVHRSAYERVTTVDGMLDYLEALRSVLAGYAASNAAERAELDALRSDMAAFRRIIGTEA